MKAETRFFGEIEYEESELLHFPKGLFGFEEEQRFLLLSYPNNEMLFSLQSVQTPGLCFTLLHPFSLAPEYAPVLQREELRSLGVERSEELCYYVLCAVKKPVSDSTVNMRCPVAVNAETRQALQVILEDDDWQMRHRLSEFAAEGGAAEC